MRATYGKTGAARRDLAVDFRLPLAVLLGLLCLAVGAQVPQRFEIRSAYVEPIQGVYQLSATLVFDLPEGARQVSAAHGGLTLPIA